MNLFVGQVGNLPPIINRRAAESGKLPDQGILLEALTGRFLIGGRLPTCPTICFAVALAASLHIANADTKEAPVGFVLSAAGSKLLRADALTPLAAMAGDPLFVGDGLRTETDPASFIFCPSKVIQTLGPSGEVRLDSKQSKVKAGQISGQPAAHACTVTTTLRVSNASQQHYGVTMARGAIKPVPPTPHDKLPADVLAELAPLDAALAANPKDEVALLSEAAIFENRKLIPNALEMYYKLKEQWPDAIWIKEKIRELEEALAIQAAATIAADLGGKTYALLVGISKYGNPGIGDLQYAHADATVFGKLLESPRGGAVPRENILLLTDKDATTAALRNGFQSFLKGATKNDTVIILIAGHGIADGKDAFIVTYDSDPQDLKSTGLAMADLTALFEAQVARVGRVLLFVDVCHSGTIGTIKSTSVNAEVEANFKNVAGDFLAMMSARRNELSIERSEYGGGHGAFSYCLLKGLAGDADENHDGIVDGEEILPYVENTVRTLTGGRQHPQEIVPGAVKFKISDVNKPGIELAYWRMIQDSRTGQPRLVASTAAADAFAEAEAAEDVDRFIAAINAGRILPDQPDNAFDSLQKLKTELDPEQYRQRENQLRVALENKAQEVLLRYLTGEQTPPSQEEFQRGARYMQAGLMLTKESLYLEGREDFFQGRALLFDKKKFPQAAQLLEQSIRIDPGAAYGYNALGIAYLEQAQYQKAIPAFRDAVRRARHWSYPLHNVALAYVETGDYKSAIKAYQDAIRLTPQYSYLPYNLGLVYQRLNRRKDAEAAYRKAASLAPDSAEPYNALGTLKASEGKRDDAEKLYRESLQKNPNLLPARHNLALLLVGEKNRQQEAIDLWRANLSQSPDYLPSRLSLAETLADRGDNAGAIEEYRKVLAAKPGYVAARLALARLLAQNGDADGALEQLRDVSKQDQRNGDVFEKIGDLEAGRRHTNEAAAAYQAALQLASDRAARKRIGNKLKGVQK
jgi:tetratricopeptide (TPR) repeat protein